MMGITLKYIRKITKKKEIKIMSKVVTVNTKKYENCWGRKPKGIGIWAFEINGQVEFIRGSFAAAKREAVALANVMNVRAVKVLS